MHEGGAVGHHLDASAHNALTILPTAFSLPGMVRDEKMTVSPALNSAVGCSSPAKRASAARGSPWAARGEGQIRSRGRRSNASMPRNAAGRRASRTSAARRRRRAQSPSPECKPAGRARDPRFRRRPQAGDVRREGGHDRPALRIADHASQRFCDIPLGRAFAFAPGYWSNRRKAPGRPLRPAPSSAPRRSAGRRSGWCRSSSRRQ